MTLAEENAEALRSLGYDPALPVAPRRIDFNLVFPNEEARAAALPILAAMSFDCRIVDDPLAQDRPEAVARKKLNVTVEAITAAEVMLNDCLTPFNAATDGWGFHGQTEH